MGAQNGGIHQGGKPTEEPPCGPTGRGSCHQALEEIQVTRESRQQTRREFNQALRTTLRAHAQGRIDQEQTHTLLLALTGMLATTLVTARINAMLEDTFTRGRR